MIEFLMVDEMCSLAMTIYRLFFSLIMPHKMKVKSRRIANLVLLNNRLCF